MYHMNVVRALCRGRFVPVGTKGKRKTAATERGVAWRFIIVVSKSQAEGKANPQ